MKNHTAQNVHLGKRRFAGLCASALLLMGTSNTALANTEPRELRLGVLLPVSGPLAFVGVCWWSRSMPAVAWTSTR